MRLLSLNLRVSPNLSHNRTKKRSRSNNREKAIISHLIFRNYTRHSLHLLRNGLFAAACFDINKVWRHVFSLFDVFYGSNGFCYLYRLYFGNNTLVYEKLLGWDWEIGLWFDWCVLSGRRTNKYRRNNNTYHFGLYLKLSRLFAMKTSINWRVDRGYLLLLMWDTILYHRVISMTYFKERLSKYMNYI